MRSTKQQRKPSPIPSLTHLQWKLHALGSGSAGPGHRCARSGRRSRKCSGGQTRTDGSLPWWPLSWTKQTASPLGRAGQPGPKQSPNRTGRPLSSQTIRIRTGTGWTGAPGREQPPGPCLEWAWLAETAARCRTLGRSTGNSSWLLFLSFFSSFFLSFLFFFWSDKLFYSANTNMQTRIWDSSDANKRSPRELLVWKTIGAEASIVGRQLQQNAALAHIIKTWLWFIFRYWPDLSRAPLFSVAYKPAMPTTWTLLYGLHRWFWSNPFSSVALFAGDNGLGFSKAPWSTAVNALFLRWDQIAFSPLWSKWSLPSALLRMLKRHPSRNCTWDGGGCDWIRWRGRNSQRAHHYNNLPDSYATAKKKNGRRRIQT